MGGLEPVPVVIGREVGYTLERSPVHHRATQRQMRQTTTLTYNEAVIVEIREKQQCRICVLCSTLFLNFYMRLQVTTYSIIVVFYLPVTVVELLFISTLVLVYKNHIVIILS